MRCVHAQPSYRPSVTDLVGELREIVKHENEASKDIGVWYLDVKVNQNYVMVALSGHKRSGPKQMK